MYVSVIPEHRYAHHDMLCSTPNSLFEPRDYDTICSDSVRGGVGAAPRPVAAFAPNPCQLEIALVSVDYRLR